MRMIDASPFDKMILKIPEDVYDAPSFIAGVEMVLDKIRKSETIICKCSDPRFDPHNPQKDGTKSSN